MTPEAPLPDAAWCRRVGARLSEDPACRDALAAIETPLFVKLKDPDTGASVILRLAAEGAAQQEVALAIHPGAQVEEEGLIVSMDLETWDRLLRGSTDLATAVLGRDVRAAGSLFRLMRIAEPAERVVAAIGRARADGEASA